MAYSNSWQTGAYSTYSDCDRMKLPAPIHVRAYLYAETSRSIKKDSYPGSETRSACSYKSSYGVSLTPLPIRVISWPFPRACFRKHFGHSSKYIDGTIRVISVPGWGEVSLSPARLSIEWITSTCLLRSTVFGWWITPPVVCCRLDDIHNIKTTTSSQSPKWAFNSLRERDSGWDPRRPPSLRLDLRVKESWLFRDFSFSFFNSLE